MPIADYMPDFGISQFQLVDIISWILIAVLFIGGVSFVAYYFMIMSKYKFKIRIFQKVGRRYQELKMDRAQIIKMGKGGDHIFLLKRNKKFLTKGRLQMAPNTYWYLIREDGEWINVDLEDFDERMKTLKVNYLHEEMRYTRAALQKFLRDSYDKVTFMQKYGGLMAYSGLIMITAIGLWLAFDKIMEAIQALNNTLEVAREVMELQKETLSAISNIRGGSGLVPA